MEVEKAGEAADLGVHARAGEYSANAPVCPNGALGTGIVPRGEPALHGLDSLALYKGIRRATSEWLPSLLYYCIACASQSRLTPDE